MKDLTIHKEKLKTPKLFVCKEFKISNYFEIGRANLILFRKSIKNFTKTSKIN